MSYKKVGTLDWVGNTGYSIGMKHLKYTKEMLEDAAKDSISIAEVLRKLGMKQAGGNHTHISKKLKEYEVDTKHFLGSRANKGKWAPNRSTPDEVLRVKEPTSCKEATSRLRRALLELERVYICNMCGLHAEWNNKPLVLQIDHINGDICDNRAENLRFICPNCHTQTDTFGSKKRK
ncbi:MAG TPA: HNH endonuclease signature motif containing protein [Methylomirabilota bacterium]|nr:HNH endonuclease signature motif containing protein [Methylomirabilota bacterium]